MKLGNRTKARRYQDACAAAHAMDLLGDRWALLVVRELMLGPKRFSDLRRDLPGISANVLTQRLDELEGAGVLARKQLPPPARARVYELTDWGYEAEPIFQALGRWAARSPLHDPTLPFGAASLMLSLRTMFDPSRARVIEARIGFRIDGDEYEVRIAEAALEARRGAAEGADLVFTGSAEAIAAAIYGGRPLAELERSGALAIAGDRALARGFIGLFPLPPKLHS